MDEFKAEILEQAERSLLGLNNVMSSAGRHYLSAAEVRPVLKAAVQTGELKTDRMKPTLLRFLGV
jgi:hypothetical protein